MAAHRFNLLAGLCISGLVLAGCGGGQDRAGLVDSLEGVFTAGDADTTQTRRNTTFSSTGLEGELLLASVVTRAPAGERIDRVRVLQILPPTGEDEVARMATRAFSASPEAYLEGHDLPALLSAITEDQLLPRNAACDVVWRTGDPGFVGTIPPGACLVETGFGMTEIRLEITLDRDGYRQVEEAYNAEGVRVVGDPDAAPPLYVRQ